MSRDDCPSANQIPFAPGYSTGWTSTPSIPISSLQSNALENPAGPSQFLGPAAVLSREDRDSMAVVGGVNYAQHFNDSNLLVFISPENPSVTRQVVDCNQGFETYMSSIYPTVMEKLDNTPTINQASPLRGVNAIGGTFPSFDREDSTTQSIASPPLSNNGRTKEQDKLLMSLKAEGLGYSAIQDEMRKKFGWTRNKNVLVKRFAVLKKRCKPQIKTRIVRDISKKITPEIIKAVGKELEKVTSSGSSSIATELEDLVPLRLPEFLERLVADVGVSLHQIVEEDKRSSA
ncbi:hypothetical protein FPRO04_03960 [Fusarium proliferatum]|nr:hypothetical protein FPRO03_06153 [Fusarium proliferatum]KAG4268871.1 hypothetical protein FPRO04_03960 [Fusarium proliferatum]